MQAEASTPMRVPQTRVSGIVGSVGSVGNVGNVGTLAGTFS